MLNVIAMTIVINEVNTQYLPPYWPPSGEDSEINEWILWSRRVAIIPLHTNPPVLEQAAYRLGERGWERAYELL